MVIAYDYDRRVAALKPTVEGFLAILKANVIQADQAQEKRDRKRGHPGNPYALGLMLKAVNKIETQVRSVLKSSEHKDLEALKRAIENNFNDVPFRRKTFKAIDAYITSGKVPSYPRGSDAQPLWR